MIYISYENACNFVFSSESSYPHEIPLPVTVQYKRDIRDSIVQTVGIMASTSGTYRPSNHHGLKEDGTPDKRMHSSDTTYKPSHHNGLKEDGTPDKRMNTGREYFQHPPPLVHTSVHIVTRRLFADRG